MPRPAYLVPQVTGFNLDVHDASSHDCSSVFFTTFLGACFIQKMSSANTARPLHPWNCLSCRQRKLRCDRHHPSCTACVRGQRDCVFPKSGRAYQRPEPQPNRQRAKARKNDLLDKLRQLETVVDGLRSGLENQGLPDQGWLGVTPLAGDTDHPRSSMNAQNTNAPNIPPTEARGMQRSEYVMVRNTDARKGVYIGDKLWATLRREVSLAGNSTYRRALITNANDIDHNCSRDICRA